MDNNVNNLRLVNGSHVIVKHTAVEILAYNIVCRSLDDFMNEVNNYLATA